MARAFDPEALDPDLRLLKNFDDAWRTDLALIRELTQQEKQAEEDRVFAARLAGVTINEASEDARKMAMLLDDFDDDIDNEDKQTTVATRKPNFIRKFYNKLSFLWNKDDNTPIVHRTTITYNQSKPKKCAVCMEYVSKNDPHTPCGHAYCVGCLKQLFRASMQDESLMPPRCCRQEIPTNLAKLTSKETEDFNNKRLEYSTTDRLYCSQPTCSTFIPPTLIVNSVGTSGSANNQLNYPYFITLDSTGAVYISDFSNNRVMKYLSGSTTGTVVAGGNGAGTSNTQLYYPLGIVYQSSSNSLVIANYDGHSVVQWVVGATNWTLLAGSATGVSGSTATLLYCPVGVATDSLGNLYVADANNFRIQFFLAGQLTGITIAGVTGTLGATPTLLYYPYGVAVDSQLNVYVADTSNNRVQKFAHY